MKNFAKFYISNMNKYKKDDCFLHTYGRKKAIGIITEILKKEKYDKKYKIKWFDDNISTHEDDETLANESMTYLGKSKLVKILYNT
jgi:hypothetical protein